MGRTPGGSNRVRAHRLARELTQAQLAAAVGVSRQTVNALEAGDYAPSVYLALRLASTLHATVEELFVIDEDRRSHDQGDRSEQGRVRQDR
jgi:putative transcriptional regulator